MLGALLALSAPAWAYRPFDSTDADVADTWEFEIELQPLGYLHEADGDSLIAPDVVANFGLTDGWEVVLEGRHRRALQAESDERRSHIEDTGLFLKTIVHEGVLQGASGTSVAIEFGALLPTLNDESGMGASALVVASHRWPLVTVHFNGEVALTRSKHTAFVAGIVFEGRTSGALRPVMEWLVEHESGHSPTARSVLLGAIWEAGETLSFDVGARIARTEGRTDYEIRAGLTWVINRDS
jgi:hypothetical protein